MPDVLTPAQRHRCMSHIRTKATKPEILVRKWLWAHGYRYRLNVKSVSETVSPNASPLCHYSVLVSNAARPSNAY